MAAAAATTTKRACAGGGLGCDRLSALPDELLHRVLSFLPSQEVVRTTVLSKRWTDLWRSVPCIDLNFCHFRRSSSSDFDWTETWERIEDFANNLLMLHRAPSLDVFRLSALFKSHNERRHIDGWVRRAIKDDPLVLEVSVTCLTTPGLYQLPHLASSPCRRLRRLQLNGISLDHSFAERLHSWWPYLDDLDVTRCCIGFSCIDSDKLENLVVIYCTNQPADVLVIRAPHLASLELDIPFSLDTGNSLVRASISLKHHALSQESEAVLIGSLFSVMTFELKGFQAMAVLHEEFDASPIFHNLRTLSLDLCFLNLSKSDVRKFKALGRFLQKSPNLEKLTLMNFKVLPVVESGDFPILINLRTLSLDECDLHDNFGLLHHCLWNSPNLEKLTVKYCKLSDGSNGREGNAKSKKTYSGSEDLARLRCPKLESSEIIHGNDNAIAELAVLNKEFNDVPVFDNLRTLSLASCFSTFKALRRFLKKSPKLEKLILKDFKGAPTVEPAEYPTLENLRTLILDKCSLHDNFWLLHHWLQNSPNLEKLSVCNCKLPDGSTGGVNKTSSRSRSLAQCPKS